MKQAALKHDDSRPVTIAAAAFGDYSGRAGSSVCDVMGYNYADPQAEAYHKANPTIPVIGTENVSAVGTRGHLRHRPDQGLRRLVRPVHDDRPRFGRRLVAVRQRAALGGRRLRVDRLRLPRRAVAVPVAEHQLAVRRHRHSAASRRTRSTTTSRGGPPSRCCTCFPHWNWPGLEGQDDRRLGLLEHGPRGALPQRPEPRREGHAEGPAPRLDREVRARRRSRRAGSKAAGR